MHRFNEHHPEFAGFSELFAREIAPQLRERDGDRVEARRLGHLFGALAAVTTLVVYGVYVWTFRRSENAFSIVMAALIWPSLAYYATFSWMLGDVRRSTKTTLVGRIFRHLGWQFEEEVEDFEAQPWQDALLVPKRAARVRFQDWISGPAHGAQFDSVEAHFENRSRDGYYTVFHGQLIWLTFDKPLGMGKTVVLRDKGLFNRKTKSGMKRVGLVDPVFERLFEAYSTDQVGARVVLDPAFMQRMIDLERALDGKNLRYAFEGHRMLIAVETGNLYEAGLMNTALDDPARAQRILDEVGAAFDIVDHLASRDRRRIS